jgi:succinyl-CoA synthetase alpha subunit
MKQYAKKHRLNNNQGGTLSILVDKKTRVLVQGITGGEGSFHTTQMMEYGTNVVAGVVPGKGGQKFNDAVPIFDTVAEAVRETGAIARALSRRANARSASCRDSFTSRDG